MSGCPICGRIFYSQQTLHRHLARRHKVGKDDDDATTQASEDNRSTTVDDEFNHSIEDDQSNQTVEDNSQSTITESMDYQGAEQPWGVDGEEESMYEGDIWEVVLGKVLRNNENIRNENGKLKWPKVIKRVKRWVTEFFFLVDRITDSPLYQEISEEEVRLLHCGYAPKEAEDMAWKNRKILIKSHLKKLMGNIDTDDDDED